MACSTAWEKNSRAAFSSPQPFIPSNQLAQTALCKQLRFDDNRGQRARAPAGSERAERVQEIGQIGERNLLQISSADSSAELVNHAIGARNDNRARITADVGCDWCRIIQKLDS